MTMQELINKRTANNQRLIAIRNDIEQRKADIQSSELQALETEVGNLETENRNLDIQILQLRAEAGAGNGQTVIPQANTQTRSEADVYSSIEYRKAFMDYVMRGVYSPILKQRADESTKTTDVKSVIVPTTITDRLFERNEDAGQIFARVTKTQYPAGVEVPIANFKPRLEWVAENGKTDRKKATTGTVSFAGYKGQVRVGISLETQIRSLEQFERGLVDAILEGCLVSYDIAIVSGSGSGAPTGIITGANYQKNAATLNNKTVTSYAEWVKIFAKIPKRKKAHACLHINESDWYKYFVGMTDDKGNPVAFELAQQNDIQRKFLGREVVVLDEEYGLGTFEGVSGNAEASKDTAFAYFFNDADYIFNTNGQLVLREYIDEETDEKVHKATVVADGKVVNSDSLLVVCRGEDAGE